MAPELAEAMTRHYLAAMAAQGTGVDEEAHRAEMAVIAAQRNAKIVGIFARLSKRDHKPRYLGYLPRVWGYLNRDLEHPALAELKRWYDARIRARGARRYRAWKEQRVDDQWTHTGDDHGGGPRHAHAPADQRQAQAAGRSGTASR